MALAVMRQGPDPRSLAPDGFMGFDWYYQVSLYRLSLLRPRDAGPSEDHDLIALEYIKLGYKGRLPYLARASQTLRRAVEVVPARRCAREEGILIIPRVPTTLYPDRERWCCQNSGNFDSDVLLFRTWFGDQDYSPEQADKLYEKLIVGWEAAWQKDDFVVNQQYCFTDGSYADVPTACMRPEARTLEEWLLTRLPDLLNWVYLDDYGCTEAEQDELEGICFVIADKEAIVNGWLLFSGINDKGGVIGRWRLPAGGLAASLLWRRKSIPESIGEAIFNRGFGHLPEPDIICRNIGSMFRVTDPPGLWWLALEKRTFTRERPSEKAPLDLSRDI
ncbi:hypothetical protein TWF481_000197 [Arthrobotrys musiformis]|uniref:Uncharacterized protein n=1 Tax=Arthrobotrys musiformis TaxID=47236 RepID=A0AAV9WSM2_9PEZI